MFAFSMLACAISLLAVEAKLESRTSPHRPSQLVQHALRYESQGDYLHRQELLQTALNAEGACASARWHLGQIEFNGEWMSPSAVADRTSRNAKVNQYRKIRRRHLDTAEGHYTIAQWCQSRELPEERKAHLLVAATLNPYDPRPQRALGRALIEGRWVSQHEYQVEKQQAEQALQAYKKWKPILISLRRRLEASQTQGYSLAHEDLFSIRDHLAIPAVEELFSLHSEQMAGLAIRWLSHQMHRDATLSLVRHAVWSQWKTVRHAAIEHLADLDANHYIPSLVEYLRPGRSGEAWFRIGNNLATRLLFVQDLNASHVSIMIAGSGGAATNNLAKQFVAETASENERRIQNASTALASLTGQDLGVKDQAWRKWWAEENGLYYDSSNEEEPPRRVFVRRETSVTTTIPGALQPSMSANRIFPSSCFSAGTPVWTRRGLVAIDQIQRGDLVLSVDPDTGELAYRAVVDRTIRPRTEITNLEVNGEALGATLGHPIWVSGKGWVKVKDLESGDRLRGCGEIHTLDSTTEGEPAMAYNLVVDEFHTYFVGQSKILVHDNTPITDSLLKVPGLKPNLDSESKPTGVTD